MSRSEIATILSQLVENMIPAIQTNPNMNLAIQLHYIHLPVFASCMLLKTIPFTTYNSIIHPSFDTIQRNQTLPNNFLLVPELFFDR
ncbi:hypothetical protein HanRHA438_Chr01g0027211 [Helianthus annuus]|nr:hypothetical protein HanHA89_Chr01g0023731 [Helianthus annuus]KAJ0783604.1 hypothetical protein HanLR1_Chr01g0022261 [Helianthus annuus]KAJ0948437.1 hypothetical protein HanRHA438_Chr01g0027211 [Helianthus annuus]